MGNFSRLVLRNTQTNRETVYYGSEMVFKMPANHIPSLKKIPELEIQINHDILNPEPDNQIQHIMVSQSYVMTTFTKSINTVLSEQVYRGMGEGKVVRTGQIVKIF